MMPRINPSVIEAVVLSVWLGAALLFSATVAPAAFAVLPSRSLAGALVGRVLPAIFVAAIVAGVVVAVLEVIGRGASLWGARGVSALVLIVTSSIAQFFVAARIDRVRAVMPPAVEALPPDDARRLAFGRLHAMSVGLLGIAIIAAFVAVVVAVRTIHPGAD